MLAVISPAKTLDYRKPIPPVDATVPRFVDEASRLAGAAAALSANDLAGLMDISEKLATLNAERFRSFETPFTPDNARPAIYAFAGDVYAGFEARSLPADAIAYAQDHLRILSGLYGLLRPLDLMQPYRLEMGTAWAPDGSKDLYAWWGERLGRALADELVGQAEPVVVNLASQEYWSAVRGLDARVIDVDFRESKGDSVRFNSFGAKRARGLMARWLCESRIDRAADLPAFDLGGYKLAPDLTTESKLTFVKPA